jgi:hypothetical protein
LSLRGVLLAVLLLPGCAAISEHTPPDWGTFDVVGHPTGAIPATLGYYGGVAVWTPAGIVLGGLFPYPVDEAVAKGPGEVIGTVVGFVLGAPFHILALPFEGGGPEPEEPPPVPPAPDR